MYVYFVYAEYFVYLFFFGAVGLMQARPKGAHTNRSAGRMAPGKSDAQYF